MSPGVAAVLLGDDKDSLLDGSLHVPSFQPVHLSSILAHSRASGPIGVGSFAPDVPVGARRPSRGLMLVGLTLGLAVMLAWKLRLLASRVSPSCIRRRSGRCESAWQ